MAIHKTKGTAPGKGSTGVRFAPTNADELKFQKEMEKEERKAIRAAGDDLMKYLVGSMRKVQSFGRKMHSTVLFAEKGAGKTFHALLIPGHKLLISYDSVSDDIVEEYYELGLHKVLGEIDTYNAMEPDLLEDGSIDPDGWQGYDISESNWTLTSSQMLARVIAKLMETAALPDEEKPDVIIHDGSADLGEAAEGAMRKRFNLEKFEGFTELGNWKKRKEYLISILAWSKRAANEGVVFTAYYEFNAGKFDPEQAPNYSGIVAKPMLIVCHIVDDYLRDVTGIPLGVTRRVEVFSSKKPRLMMTGDYFETDKQEGRLQWINCYLRYLGKDELALEQLPNIDLSYRKTGSGKVNE